MDIFRRLREQQERASVQQPADPITPQRRPWLWDFLTRVDLGAGNFRTPGDLKIERVPGAFRIVLTDHETKQATETTCQSLDDLWDRLERHLCDPAAVWKECKSYKKPGKKAETKK